MNTDWMAADDANEHIANLVKLRDRLIEERRAQVARTADSDEAGAVSDQEFARLRELQAKIEEVKELLSGEKTAVYIERSRTESEERQRHYQDLHRQRYPRAYASEMPASETGTK